ncbi:M20 aminoacylase family protein [Palleronia sp. KMU-117]|uniref:M20 aminoacylase family protein n=1 Tax=Palleronia sp. KMU-117 TaxID=3434108 RepID=UPI003D740981
MPVINRIAGYAEDMTAWRRWLHRHPELAFDCHRTAAFVAEKLRAFGVDEIHEGIATSGIVAIVNGQGEGPTIGLRADMDALPIHEETGAEWASEVPGKMHACGHDGHTTMLLGAARYLAETRNFRGRVALIFQPAEEDGGGGGVMVREGIMDRFGISQVYGVHNAPDTPVGQIDTTPGPIMAAVDEFRFDIKGKGGHAAYPHEAVDPIPAALALAQAMDTLVSRNRPPTLPLVVSVTVIHAGTASNVIPGTAHVAGTVRSFDEAMRDLCERRMREVAAGIGTAFGVEIALGYERHYPATVNHAPQTAFAADVAREVVGRDNVRDDRPPEMGAEDFAYMLEARPGAYLFIGQGDGPFCHHPKYDFNDEIAPIGASFFARLVERAQPVGG